SPKTRPTRSRARSGSRSHPRMKRSGPNTIKMGAQLGSIVTRTDRKRRGTRLAENATTIAQPVPEESERRDCEGDRRTDSYENKSRRVDAPGQGPFRRRRREIAHWGSANMWRRMETPSGTGVTAPRAAGRDRSSLLRHECTQKCRNALE